jgi:hypothetical protein
MTYDPRDLKKLADFGFMIAARDAGGIYPPGRLSATRAAALEVAIRLRKANALASLLSHPDADVRIGICEASKTIRKDSV